LSEGDAERPLSARLLHYLKEAARQPLLQFALLGGAVFLVLGGPGDGGEDAIVVDPPLRERLSLAYRAQMGALPSAEEMDALVERHVRDEMLYREALRLGLDDGDEIVRRRLIQKMEFLLESDPHDVPEARLRAYYDAHKSEFGAPALASIRLLYFDPDREGWEAAEARAKAALASGRTASADRSPLAGEYTSLGPQDAVQLFGDAPLASALYSAPVDRWSGPYRSGYGWHLLFVTRRDEAAIPPFAEVREAVARAYGESRRSERLEEVIAELSGRYEVRRVDQAR
jgi:hypothetical protein